MKTELTYLEARVTALAAYTNELKKDHATLQQAIIENAEEHEKLLKENEEFKAEKDKLQQEISELKNQNVELQTLISESVHEIKNIIGLIPEFPKKEEGASEEEAQG